MLVSVYRSTSFSWCPTFTCHPDISQEQVTLSSDWAKSVPCTRQTDYGHIWQLQINTVVSHVWWKLQQHRLGGFNLFLGCTIKLFAHMLCHSMIITSFQSGFSLSLFLLCILTVTGPHKHLKQGANLGPRGPLSCLFFQPSLLYPLLIPWIRCGLPIWRCKSNDGWITSRTAVPKHQDCPPLIWDDHLEKNEYVWFVSFIITTHNLTSEIDYFSTSFPHSAHTLAVRLSVTQCLW